MWNDSPEFVELEQALQNAQGLCDKGDFYAAEPILSQVLSNVGEDSIRGALCLSNLAHIYESKGDFKNALDCNLKLLHHNGLNLRISDQMKAVRTQRAAELYQLLGKMQDAETLRHQAEKLAVGRDYPLGTAEVEKDPDWITHALEDGVYRWVEATRRRTYHQQPDYRSTSTRTTVVDLPVSGSIRSELPEHTGTLPGAHLGPNHNVVPEMLPLRDTAAVEEGQEIIRDVLHKIETGELRFDDHGVATMRPPTETVEQAAETALEEAKAQAASASATKAIASNMRAAMKTSELEVMRSTGTAVPKGPTIVDKLSEFLQRLVPSPKQVEPGAVQEVYTSKTRARMEMVQLAGLLVLLIFFVATWNFVPRAGDPVREFSRLPHRYKDSGQSKSVWFSSSRDCVLHAGTDSAPAKLRYYFGDWRDDLSIMFGRVFERYSFLQTDKQGLRDQDGTLLYDADGHEFQLAERAQLMSQDVNSYFAEKKRYPTSIEDLGDVDWAYKNPFTGDQDSPKIISVTFPAGGEERGIESMRAHFYTGLDNGEIWAEKTKLHPGCIVCFNAVFHSSRGDIDSFVIATTDHKGRILSGDEQSSCFYLASEDGKVRSKSQAKLAKCSVVWMAVQPIDKTQLFWFKYGAAAILFTAGLFSALWAKGSRRGTSMRAGLFSLAALLALGGAYYCGLAYFH